MVTLTTNAIRTHTAQTATWSDAATGDTIPVHRMCGPGTVASLQVSGTFGGATVTFEGSNDGTNFVGLSDITGTAISATGEAIFELSISCAYVRPALTGGSGDSIDVNYVYWT